MFEITPLSSTDTTTQPIHQEHYGTGDNLRDKIVHVYQKIAPESIHEPIKMVLSSIRQKRPEKARNELNFLQAVDGLNSETRAILTILSSHIDLIEENDCSKNYGKLLHLLSSSSDELTGELCIATLIRIEVKQKKLDDARARYFQVENPGTYLLEVFYELLADTATLQTDFKDRRLYMGEVEVCGIIRGCLRNNDPDLALLASERLHGISPSFNSRVFLVLSKILILHRKISGQHFWCITNRLKIELLGCIHEIVSLLQECDGEDSRVMEYACVLFEYTLGIDESLSDVCWQYVDIIEEKYTQISSYLRFLNNKGFEHKDDVFSKVVAANKDESQKEKLLFSVITKKRLTVDDASLLAAIGDKSTIKTWVDNGGLVISESDLVSDFSLLELQVNSTCKDSAETGDLSRQSRVFFDNHEGHLCDLNPCRVLNVAEKLIDLELSLISIDLLKHFVSKEDPWLSPIVRCYLRCLQTCEHMSKLDSFLAIINPEIWDETLWNAKARQFDSQNNSAEAIKSLQRAISLAPLNIHHWRNLLSLHEKYSLPLSDTAEVLKDLPEEVFSTPSDAALYLNYRNALCGDYEKAEKTIFNWFLEDPESLAIPLTNFNFSLNIAGRKTSSHSQEIGRCKGGVQYLSNGRVVTKLLLTDTRKSHSSMVSLSSPLGQRLIEAKENEVFDWNLNEIKITKHLPAYVAAFHIALELRQTLNDGSDCFYSFCLPEEPNEMFQSLENKLTALGKGNTGFDAKDKIPLFMRGYCSNKSYPVKGALRQLYSHNEIPYPLYNDGAVESSEMVLDVYSICYLSLTGLVNGVDFSKTKIFITFETKELLLSWVEDINRKDFFEVCVMPEGGLFKQTAEDIQKQTKHIQEGIRLVLEKSEVVFPELADLSQEVTALQGVIDPSVYSTLKVSVSNKLTWLCIDKDFAGSANYFNYKVVNIASFLLEMNSNLSMQQKRPGLYLYASGCIPYPLTHRDLFMLAESREMYSHYYLAKILQMNPIALKDTSSAIAFFQKLLLLAIATCYLNGDLQGGLSITSPRHNGYTERLFYTCCSLCFYYDDEYEAEEKLAMLLKNLFIEYRRSRTFTSFLSLMASHYITGHFLSIENVNYYLQREEPEPVTH